MHALVPVALANPKTTHYVVFVGVVAVADVRRSKSIGHSLGHDPRRAFRVANADTAAKW